MHKYCKLIIILGILLKDSHEFWPPAYKIDLSDKKIFEISSDDDYDEEGEDEMIKSEDLADLVDVNSLAEDEERYRPLHSHVEHYNKREIQAPTEFADFLPNLPTNAEYEGNFVDEEKPFIAGFRDDLDKYDFERGESENIERKKRNVSGIPLKEITFADHLLRIKRNDEESKRDYDYVSSEDPNIEFMEKMSGRNTTGLDAEDETSTEMDTTHSSTEHSQSIARETTKLAKEGSTGIKETDAKPTTKMSTNEHSSTVAVKNEFTTTRNPVTTTPGRKDGSSVEDYFEKTQGQTVTSKLITTTSSERGLETPDDDTSKEGMASTSYNLLETTKEFNRSSDEIFDDSLISQKESTSRSEESYEDGELELEYNQQIKDDMNSNKTYNYTDTGEPEETAADAFKKLVEVKKPKNCTKEELTQFGIKALECLAFDYQRAKNKKDISQVLSRTWLVIRIWICIYICIAIPFWCQKGWCCCCFRCKCCFPHERIDNAKEYYAKNPPGILHEAPVKGAMSKPTNYTPTLFEIDAYERLEAAIRNL